MNNNQCSTEKGDCGKQCPIKCFVIPVIAVFATIFAFEWVWHGMLMMPMYEATKSLWRTPEEMQALFWVCIVGKLVTSAVIVCLYCCMTKNAECGGKCPKTGAKFGLKIGVLMGILSWRSYAWLPVPMEIANYWLIGGILQGVLIGVVLAFLCRMCKKDKGACNTETK